MPNPLEATNLDESTEVQEDKVLRRASVDCQRLFQSTSKDSIRRNDLREALRHIQGAKEQKAHGGTPESRSYLLALACQIIALKLPKNEPGLKQYYLTNAQRLFELADDRADSAQTKKYLEQLGIGVQDNKNKSSTTVAEKTVKEDPAKKISSDPAILPSIESDLRFLIERGTVSQWSKILAEYKKPLGLPGYLNSQSDYYSDGYRNLLLAIYDSDPELGHFPAIFR